MEIHIQLAGIQLGPYSEKQIREYVAEGLLSMTDKAREEGSQQWIDVSELMAKLPPPPEPAPAPNPDAVFVDEESVETPGAEPQRAPEAAPGVTHLPTRASEEKSNPQPPEDPFTAKTKPLGPLSPSAPKLPSKGVTASKSVSTTAPLVQATKKMSRTALARALQNKTEPMPSRSSVAASSAMPPTEVPAVAASAPETTGPMASSVAEEVVAPTPPAGKKASGLPSLLKALTAKTVPMRGGASAAPPPSQTPPSAPPVPGGSSNMPVTTPLPTRAIINPAVNRAARPSKPPPSSPSEPAQAAVPPATRELEVPTEKLPTSKKAAELRAKAAEKSAATPGKAAAPATEPDADLEPVDDTPPAPKRRSPILVVLLGLLALAGAYYVWSPYHASDTLRDAMASGDPFGLDHLVDFDAVRASLKQQAQDHASSAGGKDSQTTADAVAMLDKSIDVYITATGITNLMTGKTGEFSKDDADQAISRDVAASLVSTFVSQPIRSRGLSSPTDFALQTDVATLHLTLQGMHWKLTRIEVRSDLPAPAGTGSVPVSLLPVFQTYLNRGQDAVNNSDWKSAAVSYSRALAIAPQSSIAYNARGTAREADGDLDGAIKDFTEALTLDPQMALAYTGRGNARMARNDLDNAIADFSQALKIDPNMAIAYDSRGNAKTAKDDLGGAIQDFTQAIALDPNLASAYSDRGFARQANGNLDGAIADYTKALDLKPKTAKTYFSRGLARLSENNLQEAILDFNRALAFDPKIADAYFQRGNAKSALHDADGAISDFTETIRLNPKNALAYCSRGVAREDKGDLDGAFSDYTDSLKLDPKIAVSYFRRALIEVRKGNLDAAIADTTQSLDLDPKNTQAYYYRGFAKLVRGNLDGANSDLKLFCDAAPRDRFADNARLYIWLVAKLQNAHTDADQELSDALENSWNNSADDFTAKTAAFLLGRVTESDYLTAAGATVADIDAAQHCQAYYFAGMKRLLMGDRGTATDYFQKCLATGKKDFCEYILAQAELQTPASPPAPPAPAPAPTPEITPAPAPAGGAPKTP